MATGDAIAEFPALAAEFGVTYDRAKSLRRTGQWIEGRHYRKISDRKILYNLTAIRAWYQESFFSGCVPAKLKAGQGRGRKRGGNQEKRGITSD